MKVSFTPQIYNRNLYRTQNNQKYNTSFKAQVSPEASEFLKAIGVDTNNKVDTKYFDIPNMIEFSLRDIVESKKEDKSEDVKDLAEKIKFFGSSPNLPEIYKAQFIHRQIIGIQSANLINILALTDKLDSEEDKNTMRRALVDTYIQGASHNSELSLIDTYKFLNKVSQFMTFKEQCYTRLAIQASR